MGTEGLISLPPPHLQDAVKVMAKSLVRNRHAVTKMYGLKSQLQAVSLRIAVRLPPNLFSLIMQHARTNSLFIIFIVDGRSQRWSLHAASLSDATYRPV